MKNTNIAKFYKISFEQFAKDYQKLIGNTNLDEIKNIYEGIALPKRATKASAGYDFVSTFGFTLKPNETIKIPTGIRAKMESDYVLCIFPRSSLGFKYQMCLANTVGIIDADYYEADNEGHIIIALVNRGDKDLTINLYDRFVQGIFFAYFTVDEEEVLESRTGGFGSSGK